MHCCVNIVDVFSISMSCLDATSALLSVEHDKSYNHAWSAYYSALTSPPMASQVLGHLALLPRSYLAKFIGGMSSILPLWEADHQEYRRVSFPHHALCT